MDRILVALDVETRDEALRLADTLRGSVGGFKIGSRLFTAEGPSMVRTLTERGDRVFLDLKFHDIPNTVATAVAAAAGLGVWMVNVHASGGTAMMRAARDAAHDAAARHHLTPPLVIAVTVLTSLDDGDMRDLGVDAPAQSHALRLARLTQACGLDGVVCSAQEAPALRAACGPAFKLVTPGIRPADAAKDDQARIVTPEAAVRNGADYLVIGRPITQAADPVAVLASINASLPT